MVTSPNALTQGQKMFMSVQSFTTVITTTASGGGVSDSVTGT
ncbi:hypothetical protein L584_16450 [Pantoea agglomerans Tx10]|nr:hypothetical protein L584_16450 [Pantoea agglomerans Tx10]